MDTPMPTVENVIETAIRAAVLKVFGELANAPSAPAPESDKLTMSVQELAERLGVSRPRANDLTHVEGFPVICVGRRRLIPAVAFDQWLIENRGKVF